MTAEIVKQIMDITNEIKIINGDDYGEHFCKNALKLLYKSYYIQKIVFYFFYLLKLKI